MSLQIKCTAATFIGLWRKKSTHALLWFWRAPLHSWLWQTSLHKHSKNVALFFPSLLQRKSLSLSSKCVVSTPACTQKQWTRPGSGHWGAAKSKAASCCWHQLLIWFVTGWATWRWAGWECKQRAEITKKKKKAKRNNWDESTAAWGNKSSLCSNNRIIKHVRIGPWISCCMKVLLENAKLYILKYYEDFKRIKYYLQQRSTVYNLIFPPFFYFYFIQKKVPLETILPAAERGLETCQFLRWPNTEGLISSVCSLSLYLCICGGVSRKTTRREEGKLPVTVSWSERKKINIYIEAKANETSHTMQKVRWRWMQRAPIVPALRSATMSLHNPTHFLSTHLITNGD